MSTDSNLLIWRVVLSVACMMLVATSFSVYTPTYAQAISFGMAILLIKLEFLKIED